MFRDMMRKANQLTPEECVALLKSETRGVLSVLGDEDYPYGTPMNHWYEEEDGCLYFHCGRQGHRLDALRRHDKVSFCVCDKGVRPQGGWAFEVKSVIVFGRVTVVDDRDTVIRITTRLSRKFTQDEAYIRREIEQYAHRTLLLRLTPEHMCGKRVTEA